MNSKVNETVIVGSQFSSSDAKLSGQYSIPSIIYDAYHNSREGQDLLRQIIKTIHTNGELNKIASEDPLIDLQTKKSYTQATAEDFWREFNNVNPDLYQRLQKDFQKSFDIILRYKITKAASSADPEAFQDLDTEKNNKIFGNSQMPSFSKFLKQKSDATRIMPMKQVPIS